VDYFNKTNVKLGNNFNINYFDETLTEETMSLVKNYEAVCVFVNDKVNAKVLEHLSSVGVKLILLRCAGFNNVDLKKAEELNIKVARVPAYSPYAVAEHALALLMTVNRNTHKAYNRVKENNFLLDNMLGFDLHGKTVGVMGTGKIGLCFANIAKGLGMKILAYDKFHNKAFEELGAKYVSTDEIFASCDVISLHLPSNPETDNIINTANIAKMKKGVVIINTGRGPLINTADLIAGMKSGIIRGAGIDTYAKESGLFYYDKSYTTVDDPLFAELKSMPNVVITGH